MLSMALVKLLKITVECGPLRFTYPVVTGALITIRTVPTNLAVTDNVIILESVLTVVLAIGLMTQAIVFVLTAATSIVL